MPIRRGALLLLASALVAAGCGGEASSAGKFEGEKADVAQVVEDLQTAGERAEPDRICDAILAKALRDQIAAAGSSCEKELDKAIKEADAFDLDVKSVTLSGTKATASVEGREDGKDTLRMFEFVKEDGGWRATSFGR